MQIGMIGLGRMGANLVRRLMRHGHECIVYDANAATVQALGQEGAVTAKDLASLVAQLTPPRAIWIMLPAGTITQGTLDQLAGLAGSGDILIDGGNSMWKDDITRAKALGGRGLHYVDVGTSGGVWGLERGFCMMIGGEKAIVDHLDPIFAALAPGVGSIPATPHREGKDARAEKGYLHAGPNGAGHFVKMIHNGIEYGMMQALGEGFDILKNANSPALDPEHRLELDVADIAEVWRRGSVVTSWLLDLSAAALAKDGALDGYSGYVEDSGEGRWTIEAAMAESVPAEVLTSALYTRYRSRRDHTFAEKMLSAMRAGFGGHAEPHSKKG